MSKRKAVYKQLLCRHCHQPIHFNMGFGYWIVKGIEADGSKSIHKCPANMGGDHKLHQPMDNLSYLAWKHEQNKK